MPQTEAELEQKLIKRLTGLGYEPVTLRNAEDFKANLKTQLEDFADSFLEKCHVSKRICKYIVLHESDKVLKSCCI